MTYHLGVDLGTTYTAAAVARDGRAEAATLDTRSVAIPSVVYQAGADLLIGQAAARRSVTEPERVAREFKRRVGDPTPLVVGGTPVAAELLMAKLLQWVVKQVATNEGAPPASLAVTHPANWGEYKIDLLGQAVRHVGLQVDHWVPEPVAAASFYAAQRNLAPGSAVAVYDLGGGTFDAAVVLIEERGYRIVGKPDGIERLGGIDFDQAVFRHVMGVLGLDPATLDGADPGEVAALAQLREDCVDAKEALSHETDVSIPVLLPSRHSEVRLTRVEFEGMIRPSLDETLVALRRAIASTQMPVDALDAVLLVGGSSRIPLVAQLVQADLGRPIALDARPKDAIPLGAALVAWRRTHAGAAPPPVMSTSPPPPPLTPAATPAASPAAGGDGPGSGSSRRLVLAASGVLVVLALILGALLLQDDGDETAGGGGPTTTAEPIDNGDGDQETPTTDATTDTTVAPLPGDDWSPEARAQMVRDCAADETAQAAVDDPEAWCGCVYDKVEESGAEFSDFNEMYVNQIETQTENPVFETFNTAAFACIDEATQ